MSLKAVPVLLRPSPQRYVVCFSNVNILLFFSSPLKILTQLLAKEESLAFWDEAANPTCLYLLSLVQGVTGGTLSSHA